MGFPLQLLSDLTWLTFAFAELISMNGEGGQLVRTVSSPQDQGSAGLGQSAASTCAPSDPVIHREII